MECHNDQIYASDLCPGPIPTPSPSPSPSPSPAPTCDPSTKPNSSNCTCVPAIPPFSDAYWDCRCSAGEAANYTKFPGSPGWGGCDPNKSYNNGGDCCVCYQQTCPDGSTPNKYSCACPTPIALLTVGGGDNIYPQTGGGGNGSEPQCTNYYWVWYISYDGGATWEPTGEVEDAGCW
jgi:hypothetical protein